MNPCDHVGDLGIARTFRSKADSLGGILISLPGFALSVRSNSTPCRTPQKYTFYPPVYQVIGSKGSRSSKKPSRGSHAILVPTTKVVRAARAAEKAHHFDEKTLLSGRDSDDRTPVACV